MYNRDLMNVFMAGAILSVAELSYCTRLQTLMDDDMTFYLYSDACMSFWQFICAILSDVQLLGTLDHTKVFSETWRLNLRNEAILSVAGLPDIVLSEVIF